MITPAISVLCAVEGLEVARPALARIVVPITLRHPLRAVHGPALGTARVGTAFGPMMLVWFITIAVLGVARSIVDDPAVLAAINPWYALRFFFEHGMAGFLTLGAVVLCVTGGEALYADMGHFGKRPIRLAWFAIVLPACCSTTSARARCCCAIRGAASNPFYLLAPPSLQWPLLVIATAAAIVASQALISGAFSLTQQSIQLGYSPRMQIIHTSQARGGTDLHPRGEQGADGRLPASSCSGSATRARSARPTASPSRGRWRSRRSCSPSWRARAGTGRCRTSS